MAPDNEHRVRTGFWPKLQTHLARLPFAEDVVTAYLCATDKATPLNVKATLFGALAYFILPVDVIPDVILGLGFTDDLAVLMAAFSLVRAHITPAHRDRAKAIIEALRQGNSLPGDATA
jgi:uncharacterized membrane protein YkvA (DUF1232 family)